MECEFNWKSNINQEVRKSIEGNVKKDLHSIHSPIKACHEGHVFITLSTPDPFNEKISGNIKCSCGTTIGSINGSSDGSITYSVVENQL